MESYPAITAGAGPSCPFLRTFRAINRPRGPGGGHVCDNGCDTPASPGRSPWPTRAWTLFMQREEDTMPAARVLIAIGPAMYAEALAFYLRKHRPRAEVSLLGPSEDVGAEARCARPHLIVANRVPREARAGCFWVEVAEPIGGEGAKGLGAEISADGYSRSVADVGAGDVLAALDRAEEQPISGGGHAQEGGGGS